MTRSFTKGKFFSAFILISVLIFMAQSHFLTAQVRPAKIFQSNMVLQRNTTNLIWGIAPPNEKIRIYFDGKTYKTKAGKDGKWKSRLDPHPAGGSFNIKIKGSNEVNIDNITFGEVWLCGGQSNMQFTFRMLGKDLNTIPGVENANIRLFQSELNLDYQPQDDLKGGWWKMSSKETLPDFSAVAWYFGQLLYDSLQVPIGLLSINLGATTIETWMNAESLSSFRQFEQVLEESYGLNKSFAELNSDLKEFRKTWDKEYYLKGPGIKEKWFLPETSMDGWTQTTIPIFWEYNGLDHDGAVWFRKEFDLPAGFDGDSLGIHLNQIDDYDVTWVNGHKVGESFGNRNFRNYQVPAGILKEKGNVLVVRVFDIGGLGGFHTSAFWGNPILNGEWKYKAGLKIDPDTFPKPVVPNGSIFSYPTLLYNGNIAPATKVSIRGAIWYQGESNELRAEEYAELLPSMIQGWRKEWGYDFPFLIVQLANYKAEPETPANSNWAEIREAQANTTKLPNTYLATAIDIGEALDIHPKNKQEVGKRLGTIALDKVYGYDIVSGSPVFSKVDFENGKAMVTFENTGGGLHCTNKYGYIRGFQIAGEDQKFHWAKARLNGNIVEVFSDKVSNPVSVRYAWADNPGDLDLKNKEGWPVLPFRTDDWPLGTQGKKYDNTPHQF